MPAVNNQSDPKKQTNVTATTSSEQTTPDISFASMGGDDYPRGKSKYTAYKSIPITPVDHLQHDTSTVVNPEYVHDPSMNDASFYIRAKEHVTRDLNHPDYMDASAIRKGNEADGATFEGEFMRTKFAGSATIINPTDSEPVQALIDPDGFRKQDIVDHMGGDPSKEPTSERLDPPISPLEPFTSLHPTTARNAILHYYNRTKLPIADAEWRKGFRHIFITRPECYIMARGTVNGASTTPSNTGSSIMLSEQCRNDPDFYSAYMRVPHLCRLLSPVYVTGSFSQEGWASNWNYLLTNRVMGLSTTQVQLGYDENTPKSIEGFSVMPAKLLDSEQGSTIELSFRDTRNLEVYDCLRLWMLYAYKCKRGVLAPSYNGYAYTNGFLSGIPKNGNGMNIANVQNQLQLHPYDRALDYCATLFDIVTNESGTKILYWCKYYGIYPITASNSLTNEEGGPITSEQTVSATFKYHKKKEYSVDNLVEFNYNAGLCDAMGKVIQKAQSSIPFLLRSNEEYAYQNYIGAAEMFTGSPYIVLENGQHDTVTNTNMTIPYLRFAHIENRQLNMGLDSYQEETSTIASYL